MTDLIHADPALVARWEAWDRFLESRPDTGYRQSSWWAAGPAPGSEAAFAVVVRRGGIILGGGIVLLRRWGERRGSYLIPDGPILPPRPRGSAEVLSALVQEIRTRRAPEGLGISHLRIAPRWSDWPEHLRSLAPVPVATDPHVGPRRLISVDLRASETGILARMTPEARTNVALARRFALEVEEDPSAGGVAGLLEMAGLAADEALSALVARLRRPGRGGVLFVTDGGIRLAAAVWVRHGSRATLAFSAARHPDRQRIAPTLLQFEVMRRAKIAGCLWYELPHTPLAAALGGDPIHLAPAADIVFDPAAYHAYRAPEAP